MSKTFKQSKGEIAKLCRYFESNRKSYLTSGVKEAHVRQTLIDPFFVSLGWDVHNTALVALQYREVIPEDSLDIEGHQKAPDYAFRVGQTLKFYAEAKKCGVNINADPGSAYQLRRYGWSAKIVLSILTDFEELGVYDCTSRPRISDKASHARVLYLRFSEYADRWNEIWDIFSREAVWAGAFDQYAASKRKRGSSEVDAEFLKEIEGWRDVLARNFALRNKQLSTDDLNAAVQRTIDRVIFLRMAEDRRLEPDEQLLKLCERENIYSRFMRDLCRKADQKYNSGLFHFQREPAFSDLPDRITPALRLDDKVFKPILLSLYFTHGSPYHFGALPVEILGTVYERFLGKVIRLTAGHQAKVEEKPEVRKAGGVYYTPKYIVDYVVAQTVGKQIEGKSPVQLAKQPLRVLDMACGSGSFLLGAYQFLLDHCLSWYSDNKPDTHKKAVFQDGKGQWRLTIGEKKRILTAHIFGVDIDRQAVEVSKLSLLLKVLEGENDQTMAQQLTLFQERALPNLSNNIKCGNSLIAPNCFAGKLLPDAEELKRVNSFDWKQEFPEAMKAGGFDCVIGNPPYIRIQKMKEWAPLEVEIYKKLFKAAASGNYDIYVVFIEKGLKLLNDRGMLGFICPHKFFNSKYGVPVRGLVSDGKHLAHVVHFGDQQIFGGATTYTCLLFLHKSTTRDCRFVKVDDLGAWKVKGEGIEGIIKAERVTNAEWNFPVGKAAALFEKLSQMPVRLGDIADMFVGLQTDADDVYILEEVRRDKGKVLCESKFTGRQHWFENDHLKLFLKGSLNVRRYFLSDVTKRLIFPYETQDSKSVLIESKDYKRRFPLTWSYLEETRGRLAARNKGQMGREWYGYVYKKNHTRFGEPKLLVPSIATGSCFAADLGGQYYFVGSGGGGGGGYGITLLRETIISALYLLGLLNSRLLSAYLKAVSTPFRGGYLALNRQYIQQLPIRTINFSDPADKARHNRMVSLVDSMLALHKQLSAAISEHEKDVLQRQINAIELKIDALVYKLYGLTSKEIAIVEGNTK